MKGEAADEVRIVLDRALVVLGHDRRPNRMAAKTRSISRAIAAVCAGAACVAALAGCGTSTAGNVTLEFFQYKVEAVSQFKKLVKGFEAEHPNITIDIINTADAATDLRTRFVKNKVPDVLTVDGGRYFGEFALGVNPYILHPMKDTLFDEKIAGSFHLTPGASYEDAFNGNKSAVHWDLVMIQRPEYGGGEIYFDDVLIRKDGRFVIPQLECLNPENLK